MWQCSQNVSVSKSTRQNPVNLEQRRIIHIKVYDKLCSNGALWQIGGRQCFGLVTLDNGTKYTLERDGQNLIFQQANIEREQTHLIGEARITQSLNLKDIQRKCNQKFANKNYHVTTNNCYDFIASICQFLEEFSLSDKIIQRKRHITANMAKTIDLADAVIVAALSAGKMSQYAKLAKVSTITPLGVGVTIVAQSMSEITEMARNDWKGQSVAKGVANIAVGSAGTIGGSIGGGSVGAAIGTFIFPGAGTVVGYGVGMIIGSIGGGIVFKKIMPWNWNWKK